MREIGEGTVSCSFSTKSELSRELSRGISRPRAPPPELVQGGARQVEWAGWGSVEWAGDKAGEQGSIHRLWDPQYTQVESLSHPGSNSPKKCCSSRFNINAGMGPVS